MANTAGDIGQYVTEVTIGGVEHVVRVSRRGYFHSGQCSSETFKGLLDTLKVRASQSRVKIAVPFTWMSNHGDVRRGVATGIHGGNQAVLVRWQSGRTEQFTRYEQFQFVCGDMSEEDAAEWERLYSEYTRVSSAKEQFEVKHHFNLRKTVEEAVSKEMQDTQPAGD